MSDSSRRPFFEQSTVCLRQFREIEDEIRRPNELHLNLPVSLVSDEMDRFRRWTGSIGAVYIPSQLKRYASLEHTILGFLEGLSEDLDSGEPSSISMMDVSLILRVLQIASGRRLNRVGISFLGFLNIPRWISHVVPRRSREDLSEIHELFETCQDCISCLFRVSSALPLISNGERYDISADLALSRGDQDDQLLDIAFVRQQFPKVRATPWLEKRLGLAVTIRREFVRCSKELYIARWGKVKLGGDLDVPVGSLVVVPPVKREFDDKQLAALSSGAHCSREARSPSIYDESTALQIAGLAISEEPNDSKSADAPHETSESISKAAVASLCPPFPKEGEEGARFFCPYCWTILSFKETAEQTQKLWK